MSSGFDSLSLAVFTTLSPAGVVAFILVAIVLLFFGLDRPTASRLNRFIVIPVAVALVGFIASATHLGTPANALHVFSGIGRSPLSNEVLFAVAFLVIGGSYWMVSFKDRFPQAALRLWLCVACVAGLLFIVMTSLAYSVVTVPTWDTWFTPVNLCFSALFAGPFLALLVLGVADCRLPRFSFVLAGIACLALAVGSALLFMHNGSLGGIANNVVSAAELVPDYFLMICAHVVLGAAGALLALLSLRKGASRQGAIALLTAASVIAAVAVFIPRTAFYAMHMTVGF